MAKRIFVAGHSGMVGSAIVRQLQNNESLDLVLRSRSELDLMDLNAIKNFFSAEKIDQIYIAAAKVGGIEANNVYPADFIYENLMIECNLIHAAHLADINDALFLGSSCIYPKYAEQPIRESSLLNGMLEPTNEPYAVAKIAGIKLCESYCRQYQRNYRSVMPTNLYGKNDNFDPQKSHVIPALLSRFHQAKEKNKNTVVVWGTGKPRREFLYVDDMAEASVFVMNIDNDVYRANTQELLSHINVGTGIDCTIGELVELIAEIVGYEGNIEFDISKPDGSPRKLLDVTRLKELGWQYSVDLHEGLEKTYQWFLEQKDELRYQRK